MESPEERDNVRNNARCTQARKTTHGLDEQHQYMDRTPRGRVNQNNRGQRKMEKVRPWCGQPSNRGRLKNRKERWKMKTLSLVAAAGRHDIVSTSHGLRDSCIFVRNISFSIRLLQSAVSDEVDFPMISVPYLA